jgi:hypothetical protein
MKWRLWAVGVGTKEKRGVVFLKICPQKMAKSEL